MSKPTKSISQTPLLAPKGAPATAPKGPIFAPSNAASGASAKPAEGGFS